MILQKNYMPSLLILYNHAFFLKTVLQVQKVILSFFSSKIRVITNDFYYLKHNDYI